MRIFPQRGRAPKSTDLRSRRICLVERKRWWRTGVREPQQGCDPRIDTEPIRKLRAFVMVLAGVLWSICSFAQANDGTPPPYLCKRWDEAYLLNFNSVWLGALLGTLAIVLFSGPLVKLFPPAWMGRRPGYRAVVTGAFLFIVALVLTVLVPSYFLGRGMYAGVDPAYMRCFATPFGAAGFLDGHVGRGTAAFAQKTTIVGLLALACLIGSLGAWAVGRFTFGRRG